MSMALKSACPRMMVIVMTPRTVVMPTNRFVGITTVLGVITITIILGHALFNAMLKTQVVEIDRLDKQIALQQESVRELRLKYENAVAPLKIERLAYGQLALLPAESAIQIRLRPEHIALNKVPGPCLALCALV